MAAGERAPLPAIASMCAAMGCYAISDACIKVLAGQLASGEVLALRAAAGLLLLAALAWRGRRGRAAPNPTLSAGRIAEPRALPWVLLRCAAEAAAGFLTILALATLPLASAGALMLTAPLLIVVAVMALRWEPLSPLRLLMAACGLAGALLVLEPGWRAPANLGGASSAIGCAVALAVRDLATRRIPPQVAVTQVALAAAATTLTVGLAFGLFNGERWSFPTALQGAALVAAGLLSTSGNLLLVTACRAAALSVLAPWRYSFLLWSTALGGLAWGETPSPSALLGMALIAAAGVGAARSRN